MEKLYRVKDEYIDSWTDDVVYELFVTDDEITELAAGWDRSVSDLMEQVEEIDTPTIYGRNITDDDMQIIASYMDDDIREALHSEIAPCSNEYFILSYIGRDPEFETLLRSEFEFER